MTPRSSDVATATMTQFLSLVWAVLRNTLLPRECSFFFFWLLVRSPGLLLPRHRREEEAPEEARPDSPAAKLLYIHY
jgi:hypothetical protein